MSTDLEEVKEVTEENEEEKPVVYDDITKWNAKIVTPVIPEKAPEDRMVEFLLIMTFLRVMGRSFHIDSTRISFAEFPLNGS